MAKLPSFLSQLGMPARAGATSKGPEADHPGTEWSSCSSESSEDSHNEVATGSLAGIDTPESDEYDSDLVDYSSESEVEVSQPEKRHPTFFFEDGSLRLLVCGV